VAKKKIKDMRIKRRNKNVYYMRRKKKNVFVNTGKSFVHHNSNDE